MTAIYAIGLAAITVGFGWLVYEFYRAPKI